MGNFLRKLFNKTQPNEAVTVPARPPLPNEATTAPLTESQLEEIVSAQRIEPSQLIVGVGRNVGRQRDQNEDAVFTHSATISVSSASTPFGIFLLADGMGGHANGHLASENAVRAMGQHLMSKLYDPLFSPSPHSPDESLQDIMRAGVYIANDTIHKNAPGGGTTLTAAVVIGKQMTIAHVGDSRAYSLFLDGRMQMLTRDHSLVKRLEELGQISAEEAAFHPQKSMLYRALGQGEPAEPDVFTATMPSPGYLVLCSDGLWGVITEDEIFRIVLAAPNPQRACQQLIEAANNAGGPDNISVILARISD